MTTFDQAESGVELSRPVELISFAVGATSYRYTTAPVDIVFGGNTYTAESITRSNVILGTAAHDQTLEIIVPASNAFAGLYIDIVPSQQASCIVLRLQRGEVPALTTSAAVFKGRVKAVKFQNAALSAIIGVQSLEASLNKQMGAYTYQGPCNHQLYSAACGADPAAHTFTGSVSLVSGANITVPGVGASGKKMPGGYVKPASTSDFRLVIAQSTDLLTLLLPFGFDALGATVDCVAGCDHLLNGDCGAVFDRVLSYGGFAFTPIKNPFGGSL